MEVLKSAILTHLKVLMSEFGFKADQRRELLSQIQMAKNMTPQADRRKLTAMKIFLPQKEVATENIHESPKPHDLKLHLATRPSQDSLQRTTTT